MIDDGLPIATHHHLIYFTFIMCQLSLLLKVFLAHFQCPWFFFANEPSFTKLFFAKCFWCNLKKKKLHVWIHLSSFAQKDLLLSINNLYLQAYFIVCVELLFWGPFETPIHERRYASIGDNSLF
jgi:hypothetical protein